MSLPVKGPEVLEIEGMYVEAAGSVRPPQRMSVAEYAQKHRYLPGGSGRGDRWRNEKTPYLVEPMEWLTSRMYQTIAIPGPGQVGKTVVPENWLLQSVALDPAPFLWYMQSDDSLEAYVKARINPMIDDHDEMRTALGPRPIDDSLHFKLFRGMTAQFLTASMGNLINKNAPRIVADEIDAWGIDGDVKPLLDIRRQSFGDESMLLALSHPDKATGMIPERDWLAGIMAIYADSTRCVWYWECPICGGVSSPNPMAARFMSLEYPTEGSLDAVEDGSYLLCPVNQCKIKEHKRNGMNKNGIWIGDGQEIRKDGKITGQRVNRKTAGAWIVGAMSSFIMGGIGGLAKARVKAERERDAGEDDDALRQVIVKQWGIPYAPSRAVGSISANDLADRAEPDLKTGEVPEGVRFIVIAVDCQLGYFEWICRGFGERGESWIIDRGRFTANPATDADDWDMLQDLFTKRWPLADGSGRTMVARAAGFDSAGQPGITQQAYSAWSRWKKKGKVSSKGTLGGREVWSVLPLKGASTLNAAKLSVVYPDTSRKANKLVGRGDVPVGIFNPNTFKDDLGGQLMKAEPGPWYVHYPFALRSKEAPHIWFEQMVAETRLANGRWEKLNKSARNETLDLMVMSHVLAHLHGLSRINWEKPPAWAAPWATNALVSAAKAVNASGEKVGGEPRKGGALKITIDVPPDKPVRRRLAS